MGFLVVVSLAVAGCGGGSNSASTSPTSVTVALGTKPSTLDPDLAQSPTDIQTLHLIAGTLFNLARDGKRTPGLATEVKISQGGLTQTFTLRPDLKFSDGSPLTSQDVVATFVRAMNDKGNTYPGFVARIKSVSASGPRSVVFRMDRPYPSFPTITTGPEFTILPAKDLNPSKGTAKAGFLEATISDGPFKLQSWDGGRTMSLLANPNYWGPSPKVKTVKFVTVENASTSLNELRSGQVDFSAPLAPSYIPELESSSEIHVMPVKQYGFYALDMNNNAPPLNNVKVRQAISLAVNRPELVEKVFFGKTEPIAGFWPSTMDGFDPSISVQPDVGRAKQLLAGTECAHGCTIPFVYETEAEPYLTQMSVLLQNQLKAIGINLRLTQVDFATYVSEISTEHYVMSGGGLYDFANVPDGLSYYGLTPEGGLNSLFSGYSSPEMDRLIATADQTTGQERADALNAISQLFVKDQPYVTLGDWMTVAASRLSPDLIYMAPAGYIEIGSE
jgi:ABC-type transport system substrate-binding protein